MSKAPVVTMDQLGAVIDTITTINAAMFTMIASSQEVRAALALLDQFQAIRDDPDPLQQIRASVAEATAASLRGLQAAVEGSTPAGTSTN